MPVFSCTGKCNKGRTIKQGQAEIFPAKKIFRTYGKSPGKISETVVICRVGLPVAVFMLHIVYAADEINTGKNSFVISSLEENRKNLLVIFSHCVIRTERNRYGAEPAE